MTCERLKCWVPLVVLLGAGAMLFRAMPVAPPGSSVARALLADWSWLKANLAWEQHDEARTRAWADAAIATAPERDYFRINAARMRAFDFPAWRVARSPGAPAAVQARWRNQAADEAIALLASSGDEPGADCLLEAGNIALYGGGDAARAAEFYRRAAEQPDAPWHAGRIYAELLRQTGRSVEALAWLRAWWPRLPADDPAAQRELVATRIAELERELAAR